MTFYVSNRPLMKWPLKVQSVSLLLLLLLTGLVPSVFAESQDYKKRPLDVRVDRLERLMSSQKQLELLYRMKQLQEENQQLRSLLEDQSNELRLLKQQQKELYSDLNRRLERMEGNAQNVLPDSDSSHNLTKPVLMNPGDSDSMRTEGSKSAEGSKSSAEGYKSAEGSTIQESREVEIIEKSSVKQPIYGITEREEVLVDAVKKPGTASKPSAEKPPVATIKPMSEKERKAEQKAYQKAYDELRAQRYNKARESFTHFIQQYPNGRYAHIAQYWVAESNYVERNYEQAIVEYQLLLDVYPFSPKKAEAELKKAFSYYELGNMQKARLVLDELLRTYPSTTEAGQAKRLLKKL